MILFRMLILKVLSVEISPTVVDCKLVPFDKVTEIYLFESALDAMSFYEINHFNKNTTCALSARR